MYDWGNGEKIVKMQPTYPCPRKQKQKKNKKTKTKKTKTKTKREEVKKQQANPCSGRNG